MSNRVYIFDTTLRDGEQSPGCSMNMPEKLRMAAKLVDLGVDILEAGFPIASDGDFEAVDAVSREFPWVQVAALARSCTLDVERAAGALKNARRPRIHTFIATSDIHLKYKLKKSRQQVLDDAVAAVELARSLSATPPLALLRVRELLDRASTHTLAEHLDLEQQRVSELWRTHDFVEGVSAFLQRRKPQFRGN